MQEGERAPVTAFLASRSKVRRPSSRLATPAPSAVARVRGCLTRSSGCREAVSGEDANCGEGDAYEVEIVIAAFVVVSDAGRRSREESMVASSEPMGGRASPSPVAHEEEKYVQGRKVCTGKRRTESTAVDRAVASLLL